MPISQREKGELIYAKGKRKISHNFSVAWRRLSLSEGISGAIIAAIEACIGLIIALLLIPEPVITKVTAALIAAGAGLLGAIAVVGILILSKDTFEKYVKETDEAEKGLDDAHEDWLRSLNFNAAGSEAESETENQWALPVSVSSEALNLPLNAAD